MQKEHVYSAGAMKPTTVQKEYNTITVVLYYLSIQPTRQTKVCPPEQVPLGQEVSDIM